MGNYEHNLLIIYTSKNGRTGGMVEPVRQGMIEGGVNVAVRTVDEVTWDEMLAAQGVIVGTPVRFGDVDWQIKVKVLGQWGHQPSHKSFAIIEASDFAAVTALLRGLMLIGKTEVLPVTDGIAARKARGWWES